MKNASKDLKTIVSQLRSLRDVLEDLYAVVASDGSDGDRSSSSASLSTLTLLNREDGPLVHCTNELRVLEKIMDKTSKWRQALTWPLKETEIKRTLASLETIKSTLLIALSVDQR